MHPRAAQQRLLTIALLSRPPRAHALLGGLRRSFSDSVAIKYEPHRNDPALFNPAAISAWLHPEFQSMLAAVRDADTMDLPTESIVRDHVNEEARDIYSFPLLSDEAAGVRTAALEVMGKLEQSELAPHAAEFLIPLLRDDTDEVCIATL